MIILFPVPGYVAKTIQSVQAEKMNKVGFHSFLGRYDAYCNPKTDARVETVTESEYTMQP